MKKFLVLFFTLCFVVACGFGLFKMYKLSRAEKEIEGSEDQPIKSRQFITTNSTGQTVLKLSPEEQKKFGIETKILSQTSLKSEFYTFGIVLDISPLVESLTELKTTLVNLELAKRQYAREKKLYEEGRNAPLKNVEFAEAEVRKLEESIRGIQNRIALRWGEKIATLRDLESFLRPFIENRQSLVRIDLLPGQSLEKPPESVKFSLIGNEKTLYSGEYFSTPKIVEQGNFTRSMIYLIKGESLPVGMKLKAIFEVNSAIHGTFVPDSAIVRVSGDLCVYKMMGPDKFLRIAIKPDFPTAGGWILTNSLDSTEQIVVKGAQMLLSEELKSQIRLVE